MGHEKYKEIENCVDSYYQSEKTLCKSIKSMFEDSYPYLKLSSFKLKISNKLYELYSKTLTKKLESFYSYTPSGRYDYTGETDLENIHLHSSVNIPDFFKNKSDTIYEGNFES